MCKAVTVDQLWRVVSGAIASPTVELSGALTGHDQLELVGVAAWLPGWDEVVEADLSHPVGRRGGSASCQRGDLRRPHTKTAVVVYLSLREGFGLPVLEAIAHGEPVVNSSGTVTEEVAGDPARERAGTITWPRSAEAYAEAARTWS